MFCICLWLIIARVEFVSEIISSLAYQLPYCIMKWKVPSAQSAVKCLYCRYYVVCNENFVLGRRYPALNSAFFCIFTIRTVHLHLALRKPSSHLSCNFLGVMKSSLGQYEIHCPLIGGQDMKYCTVIGSTGKVGVTYLSHMTSGEYL